MVDPASLLDDLSDELRCRVIELGEDAAFVDRKDGETPFFASLDQLVLTGILSVSAEGVFHLYSLTDLGWQVNALLAGRYFSDGTIVANDDDLPEPSDDPDDGERMAA